MKIPYIVGPYAAKYDGAKSYQERIVLWPHRMYSPVLAAITRAGTFGLDGIIILAWEPSGETLRRLVLIV